MIKDKERVAILPTDDPVYIIKGVEFVPFSAEKIEETPEHTLKEISRYIFEIKHMLENDGFYFTYGADITNSQQN